MASLTISVVSCCDIMMWQSLSFRDGERCGVINSKVKPYCFPQRFLSINITLEDWVTFQTAKFCKFVPRALLQVNAIACFSSLLHSIFMPFENSCKMFIYGRIDPISYLKLWCRLKFTAFKLQKPFLLLMGNSFYLWSDLLAESMCHFACTTEKSFFIVWTKC